MTKSISPEFQRYCAARRIFHKAMIAAEPFPFGSDELEVAEAAVTVASEAHTYAIDALVARPVRFWEDVIELARIAKAEDWYHEKLEPALLAAVLTMAAQ